MNFQRGLGRDEPEINLIPLIDVLLVILIFLMVTTTYARFAELQINLPEARGDSGQEAPARIEIAVGADGVYRINDAVLGAVDVERLSAALARAAEPESEPVVVIGADARATHQAVVRVMDAARRAGLTQISFVTQSTEYR